MNRFTRFSRISPALLLRRRERRAWCSLSITLGILTSISALLGMRLIYIPHSGGDFIFYSVAYTVTKREQVSPPPLVSHATPPKPHINPQPIQTNAPHALLPEEVDDTELAALAAEQIPAPDETEWDTLPPPIKTHRPAPFPPKKESTTAAAPIHAPHPSYPARMLQRRLEGDVDICIHIDAEGIPTAVDILTEVHPDFAEHTRRWILRHWRFRAAQKGSIAIASTLRTGIRYRLDN